MPAKASRQTPAPGARVHPLSASRAKSDAPGRDLPCAVGSVRPYFEREHRRLSAQFHEHLMDVGGGSSIVARQHVQRWRHALARHIRIEDTRLLPYVPPGARWSARLYRLEHARITALADAYVLRVDAVSENLPRDDRSARETILALLDAAHALRRLLEHHHQREETAPAMELPVALQEAAWGYGSGRAGRPPGDHACDFIRGCP